MISNRLKAYNIYLEYFNLLVLTVLMESKKFSNWFVKLAVNIL